ncbi:MBL fold metallo-hydrolase [Clostridium sp. BL-8]|uniref:MBL fold metallo-hydrolase n=1 Tax=Clostridium sp. BL-8 TaxID=349938 RepID=UPI00098C81F5|nr:MBL fold metallo-hydrolase [Clostridium sp. BL-8]OOM75704.1 metallo-beta-lactamase L1 precursor [Clostridium sp. BL-8]
MNEEKINLPQELFDNTPLEPTKVFDNLYCVGSRSVVAWALKTFEGIILIDSMWDNHDAQLIIDGMKKMDLSPQEIKYIIITHGHGDHYGGAQFIKDNYKAKIAMSETDYNFMNTVNSGANGSRSPKCSVDIMIKDGQKIELGDTIVTIIETPGHTPGCISLIFSVKDNGTNYNTVLWGGTGAPSDLEGKLDYRKSIDYFEKYAQIEHATVEITAHLFSENGYSKLETVRNRKGNETNPFFIGEEGIKNYFDNLRKQINYMIEKQKNKSGEN